MRCLILAIVFPVLALLLLGLGALLLGFLESYLNSKLPEGHKIKIPSSRYNPRDDLYSDHKNF